MSDTVKFGFVGNGQHGEDTGGGGGGTAQQDGLNYAFE